MQGGQLALLPWLGFGLAERRKETRFAGTGKLWHYWMGIENTTTGWRWPDGTLTTGYVSNANPYSHWYNNFQTTWTVTDCIFGHLSYPYSK